MGLDEGRNKVYTKITVVVVDQKEKTHMKNKTESYKIREISKLNENLLYTDMKPKKKLAVRIATRIDELPSWLYYAILILGAVLFVKGGYAAMILFFKICVR